MATDEDHAALDQDTERQVAVDLFNHVWTLLETEGRTPEQDDRMVHAARVAVPLGRGRRRREPRAG